VLAVIVMVATGIRLVFVLLLPVMPELIVVTIVFGIVRVVSWWRGRW